MFLYTENTKNPLGNVELEKAKFGILGIPFDSTESRIPGQRLSPDFIRKEARKLKLNQKIYDLGDLTAVHGNAKKTLFRIEQTLDDLFLQNKSIIPILLGGEHSITLGAINALIKTHKDLQVISLDAHLDLFDEYLEEKLTHMTVMRRISELKIPVYVIGSRIVYKDEKNYLKNISTKMEDIDFSKPTYLSIDMDVFDPKFVPGVGDPVPKGMSPEEVFKIISKLKNIIGGDIVEANPFIEKEKTFKIATECLKEMINNA